MKEFNVTGLCIPEKHYMCDVSAKFAKCKELIEKGKYFAINYPRQHGKTTMQYLLQEEFKQYDDYLVVSMSFEGVGDIPFETEENLASSFLEVMAKSFWLSNPDLAEFLENEAENITSFKKLSNWIRKWVQSLNKKVILLVDEVDKASNNQTFISLLAILRDKYLDATKKQDITFHSVVLIGVHDIKSLKLKIRLEDGENLNSPWNIAENLNVDFAFTAKEIEPMLADYTKEHNIKVPITRIASKIFYYTSGNPFLVSMFCKIIDEKLIDKETQDWSIKDIEEAYLYLVDGGYTTTNFDDVNKNLENDIELFSVVQNIAIQGETYKYNVDDPIIARGKTFGILCKNKKGQCDITNKVYEFRIFDYMLSKERTREAQLNLYASREFKKNGELNVVMILEAFQRFMREHHSSKDNDFLEKNGRLLLMSFLRPIVNGHGYMFKENVTSEDRKMDLVITFNNKRYVIELKIWYGQKYLNDGVEQLCEYLDTYDLESGAMLIYNFNKKKKYETLKVENCRKNITAVFV